ncbi:MAG TPA: PQQ-binding-like beta-propeller repeat protein [Blastocatellia bacterium]|nr:PQQ-binding-like beta-propeller repeat protein [Blastocatellia bacterium]
MRKLLTSIIVLILIPVAGYPDNWPQWRGASGNGVTTETGLPTRWSKDDVAWKAPLRGLGVSSPIVWGDRVFVTSQLGQAELRPGSHPTLARGPEAASEKPMSKSNPVAEKQIYFLVEAFRKSDGSRLWEYRLPAEGKLAPVHQKHNLASPSPVTDGNLVYAWFGNGQLVALNLDGKLAWQRHLGTEVSPFEIEWGHGSSPTIYRDTLILLCDHIPASHLLALDKKTGKERWKVDRGKGVRSYSTPTVVRGPSGDELIVNASERIDSYDPNTGKHLWYTGEPNRFPIPVPSYENGVLYASRGYRSGPFMAIRLGGKGDITNTHVQWHVPTGAPYISSLVQYQGLIYMANDAGVASCVDARTGEKVWQQRMDGIFSASPVAGDGKVYMMSETGETIVLKAGREFQVLARNDIAERIVASPAISGGQIFIRTDTFLFCVGKKSPGVVR